MTLGLGHKSFTISSSQRMETMHKNSMGLEKENIKINISSPTCTNQVKKFTKEVEISEFDLNPCCGFFSGIIVLGEMLCCVSWM